MLSKVCLKLQFLSQPDRGDPAVYFVWFGGLVLRPLFVTRRKGADQAIFRRTRWIVAVETLCPFAICLMLWPR